MRTQKRKITPIITREISELVFGVNMFDLELGVQVDSANSQSNATLWILDMCLIVELLPLMIMLITASFCLQKCTTGLLP